MSAIAMILREAARPGLLGLIGKALAKRCRRDLEAHFKGVGKKILALELQALAHPEHGPANAEQARHAVEMKLHNVLRMARPNIEAILKTNIAEAIHQAGKMDVMTEAAGDQSNPGIDKVGMTAQQAADYAVQHAGELIDGIDQTTVQAIGDAVATGIEQMLGVDGTAGLISDVIDGLSGWRAQMIATTEMNNAMSVAFLGKLRANDVSYKQWILGPDPCPICEDNKAASPIPTDEDFPSGDDAPPAHPNCRCAIAGARAPDLEEACA